MAKKNGRKKTGEKKIGKIIPEKYHGNFLLENLPQNIFENFNPENNGRENEGDKKPGISPADYIAIFRKAEIMSRNNGRVLQWRYIGELVEAHLQMLSSEHQETGHAQRRSLSHSTATQEDQATSHPGRRQTRQHGRQATQEHSHTTRTAHAVGKAAQWQGKAAGEATGRTQRRRHTGAQRH